MSDGPRATGVSVCLAERLFALAVLAPAIVGSYVYLNQHPLVPARLLPLSYVDRVTPFWVWTVWPYTFLTLSNGWLPFCIRTRENFFRMVLTLTVAIVILCAFWAAFPTTYLRPEPPEGDSWSEKLYLSLIQVDTALNCFPSAHVAAPSVQLYYICSEQRRWAACIWGSFGLLSLSIFTTKQHYAWDLLGAIAVVVVSVKTCQWLVVRASLHSAWK